MAVGDPNQPATPASPETTGKPGSPATVTFNAPGGAAAPPQPPSMADRLAEVRVGLRADLQVTRHLFRGRPSYIIRDPISFDTHRLSPDDYQILICIRNDQPLGEIFESLVRQGRLHADDKDAFYGFIVELHRSGFLSLPIVDASTLNKRRLQKRRARIKQLLLSPVFIKLPGINPDAFLDRTVGRVSWIFSKGFFVVWLILMAAAGVTLLRNVDRLGEPLNTALVAGNLPLLWLTLIVLKVFHEFGHAYACKSFGGRVPEMGVFLVALTPCAFVDASDSWSFTSRRARLIVCLAGMYVELAIAAVAIIVWSLTGESLLNALAFNVALLSSLLTILFNINPLMRYDGYYAFSDMVEVPNLREKSKATLHTLLRRAVIGDVEPDGEHEKTSVGMTVFLVCFGVASTLYRMSVVLGISVMIATKLFLPGLALGAMYLGNQLVSTLRGMIRTVRTVTRPAARIRAAVAAAILFAVLPAVFFTVPLPDGIYVQAVAVPATEREIFAPVEGFVEQVDAEAGQRVRAGQPLLRLRNDQLEEDYINARAERRVAGLRVEAAMLASPVEAEVRSHEAGAAESHYRDVARRRARQSVAAPIDGRLLNCLPESAVGSAVAPGQPVATIAADGWTVRFLLNSDQLTRLDPSPGDAVSFRSAHLGIYAAEARITRVSPGGERTIDAMELTHLAEGDIPVDPATGQAQRPYYLVEARIESDDVPLLRGMTGEVKMDAEPRTTASRLAAKFRRFLFNLRQ